MADLRMTAGTMPAAKAEAPSGQAVHGWMLVLAPVLGYIAMLVFAFVSAFGLAAEFKPTQAQIDAITKNLPTDTTVIDVLTIVLYAAVFVAMWLLLPKRGPDRLASYFRRVSLASLLFAAVTGLALVMVLIASQTYAELHHIATFHTTESERVIAPTNFAMLGPTLLVLSVVDPIVEETYFRGLLLRWLGSKMHWVLAVPLSAFLFAAVHFKFESHAPLEGWILTGDLALVGVAAAVWALAARSLWPAVVVHGTYNGVIVALPLLATQLHLS